MATKPGTEGIAAKKESTGKATPPLEAKRGRAQTIKGVVVSDKMTKTCIVETSRAVRHGLYHKALKRQSRVFVHDEKNEAKTGDTVIAVFDRPLSKHKSFRLLKIVEKRAEA
jgi:small subunit ribosomal protein S17